MTSPQLPKRPCPACAGMRSIRLFRQQFATLSTESLLEGYDVAVCSRCGCGYADHIPAQVDFDAYYRRMSKYEYQDMGGKESDFDMRRFQDIAELLTPFIQGTQARVLDVGCATGGLLHQLQHRGFSDLIGMDPSPACATAAQSLYGLPVRTQTLSELGCTQERFDFIVLVGVLEHVRDLTAELTRLRNVLTPGGRLYVEVPDVLGFERCFDAPFQQFSMEHINFFSPASLQTLMTRNGFTPIFEAQTQRQHSRESVMPVVTAVYEKRGDDLPSPPLTSCPGTAAALRAYLARSRRVEGRLRRVIARLSRSGRPILVWGTGTHTLRLMRTSRLHEVNIAAFVDSNPRYQGKCLYEIPIISPQAVRGRPEPILISSRVFQSEIAAQIRNQLEIPNPLILLYDSTETRPAGGVR